jgi:hypothetical protein
MLTRYATHGYTTNFIREQAYASYSHKNRNFYAQLYDRGGGYTGETKHIFGVGNSIGLQYRKGNCIFGAGASNVFIHSKTMIENISHIAPYTQTLLTADWNNLFFLKLAVNVDFGRKFNSGRQRISNSDSDSNTLETG